MVSVRIYKFQTEVPSFRLLTLRAGRFNMHVGVASNQLRRITVDGLCVVVDTVFIPFYSNSMIEIEALDLLIVHRWRIEYI